MRSSRERDRVFNNQPNNNQGTLFNKLLKNISSKKKSWKVKQIQTQLTTDLETEIELSESESQVSSSPFEGQGIGTILSNDLSDAETYSLS